jgi:hypothetical protein
MTRLYAEVRVWKRHDKTTAILYRCFQDLVERKFAVQSADYFRLPIDQRQIRNSERQFFELFIEIAPRERCGWFDSVEEAIAAHDLEFL